MLILGTATRGAWSDAGNAELINDPPEVGGSSATHENAGPSAAAAPGVLPLRCPAEVGRDHGPSSTGEVGLDHGSGPCMSRSVALEKPPLRRVEKSKASSWTVPF